MKNGLRVLASISLIGIQAQPALMHAAEAQEVITITGTRDPNPPCPVNATCYSGGGGYSSGGTGGGGGGYIPENEAVLLAAAAAVAAQARQIADGIVMVCPKPGEPFQPTYYNRAMSDCKDQVAKALGALSTPTITTAACGFQASRVALAFEGQDTCK